MPDFMTEDQFARLVAEKVNEESGNFADVDTNVVDAELSVVIEAVLEALDRHGPVVLGD